MHIDRNGIILYVLKYEECVTFYGEILGLEVMFKTEELTCFQFGDSYLMVEVDDENGGRKEVTFRTRTCLRMNVAAAEVKAWAQKLMNLGVEVDYQEHSWGTVAKFYDPDGNLCAFKDSEKFEQQVAAG